jgi:hypothetical protein
MFMLWRRLPRPPHFTSPPQCGCEEWLPSFPNLHSPLSEFHPTLSPCPAHVPVAQGSRPCSMQRQSTFYRIYPRYLCHFISYLPPSLPSSSSYPPSPQLVPRQYAAGRLPHQVPPVQAFLLPYVDEKCHNHGRGVRRSPPPTSRLAGLERSNVSLAGLSYGRYGAWGGVVFGCMQFSGLSIR